MINPYLTFPGNTEEAFTFYKDALGGDFKTFQRFGDTEHGANMSDSDKQKIMHVTLECPHGTLMANDHLDFMGEPFRSGNNFSLSINTESEDEAKQLFDRLSEGGKVTMPLGKVFWGAYFGMFTDKFGVKWMVNCG
jgi:PhnB protein